MSPRLTIPITLLFLILALPPSVGAVQACGFWGDGDVGAITNDRDVRPDGRLLSEPDPIVLRGIAQAKLQDAEGYGYAVFTESRAEPMGSSLDARERHKIRALSAQGYATVIDLSASRETAHERETKDAGMLYFPLPLIGGMPTPAQVREFSRLVAEPNNLPMLIYAPTSQLFPILWTANGVLAGAPLPSTIADARKLGLSYETETDLYWHVKNGKLKALLDDR